MAKLILSIDDMVIREVPLDKERVVIGRKPTSDVIIDNLAVSGDHAAVTTILHDSFLEDLNSTNGTLVNGNPIKKHFLQNNDVIEIGKYKLKYIGDTAVKPAAEDFEKTMILRPPAAAHATPSSTATPAAQAAEPPLAAIQIISGPGVGKELVLTKNLTTLGKPGVQVAVIARRPHGYFITHVEGTHFPIVNGQNLDAQAHPLNDHDVIELAGVKMEFFLKNS